MLCNTSDFARHLNGTVLVPSTLRFFRQRCSSIGVHGGAPIIGVVAGARTRGGFSSFLTSVAQTLLARHTYMP